MQSVVWKWNGTAIAAAVRAGEVSASEVVEVILRASRS